MHLPSWRLGLGLAAGAVFAWIAGCSDDEPAGTPAFEDPEGGAAAGAPTPPRFEEKDKNGLWKHLECSGLYKSIADKTLAEGVKAYKPANEFWSDGAEKARFVFIPAGQKIDITDWDEWQFPVGTKFWKEFKLGGKRI